MKAIILSASSDIGIELIKSLSQRGLKFGTYNSTYPDTNFINPKNLLKLDIADYDEKNIKIG